MTILPHETAVILPGVLLGSLMAQPEGRTIMNMNNNVFWDVTPCSLVKFY
jgi:hypothetical protein